MPVVTELLLKLMNYKNIKNGKFTYQFETVFL